jgi:hypothetical protein
VKRYLVGAGTAVLIGGALIGSALAATTSGTQNLDATLNSSITLSLSTPNVGLALPSSGTGSASGGTATVTSNSPYTVTVQSDGATLREWDGSGYVTGGASLASPPSLTIASNSGTGVAGVGGPVIDAAPTAVAAGVGLGTDVYGLTVNQATTVADSALPAGNTYHAQFTYTAANLI